jgi:glucose 1-dehydrogenase
MPSPSEADQAHPLRGRVALVTGAAGGIGKGVALDFAEAGACVVVNDFGSGGLAQGVVEEIRAAGGQALLHEADVSDREAARAMIAAAVNRFGRLDIAVAGHAFSVREPVLEASWEGMLRTVEVMQLGVVHVFQLAAQQMADQAPIGESRGKLILIGSVRAFLPIGGSAAYNMAKAASAQFARTMACELAPRRINVNIVNPGWVNTPGERKYFSEREIQAAGAATIPWGRLGSPEDVAKAVRFLAGSDADYITGAEILVDGGYVLGVDRYAALAEIRAEEATKRAMTGP